MLLLLVCPFSYLLHDLNSLTSSPFLCCCSVLFYFLVWCISHCLLFVSIIPIRSLWSSYISRLVKDKWWELVFVPACWSSFVIRFKVVGLHWIFEVALFVLNISFFEFSIPHPFVALHAFVGYYRYIAVVVAMCSLCFYFFYLRFLCFVWFFVFVLFIPFFFFPLSLLFIPQFIFILINIMPLMFTIFTIVGNILIFHRLPEYNGIILTV